MYPTGEETTGVFKARLTGEMIKYLRDRKGLTQSELATTLGLAEGTVRNYEKGARVDKEAPVTIPFVIDWALAAVYEGLRPFSEMRTKQTEKN